MRKNILVIYDERSTYTKTVQEHVAAFKEFSRHNVFFVTGTNWFWPTSQGYTTDFDQKSIIPPKWNFEFFDVIIIHYSVRTNLRGYIADFIAESIKKFSGPKILFIQDEYEGVDEAIRNIDYLGIDVIYTCVPLESVSFVYGNLRRKDIKFIRNLTGYVPYLDAVEKHALALEERDVLVGYRGRRLPHHYGRLGFDKLDIGDRFKIYAEAAGLKVDIETSDDKRIYKGWYSFIGSCRATIGTPSGANIFDFDGSLKEKAQALAGESFESVYDQHFREYEGHVVMDQISPKFFEAILLRTALICYPGNYSGILKEGEHYISLERNFSNFGEVVAKISDLDFLRALTTKAYDDIISGGLYSYKTFISGVDETIDELVENRKYEIVTTPIGFFDTDSYKGFGPQRPSDFLINNAVLFGDIGREQFISQYLPAAADDAEIKWNCARIQDGASIKRASRFHPAPHDAESLIKPFKPGNYAACLDDQALPHMFEIDLGTKRVVKGFGIWWLSPENFGRKFAIEVSSNGFFWRAVAGDTNNTEQTCEYEIKPTAARYIRVIVTETGGQQRLLVRRFEVYAGHRRDMR